MPKGGPSPATQTGPVPLVSSPASLWTDPRSNFSVSRIPGQLDQGSVVVLRRRAFLSAEVPGHPDMNRDLNYSGLIPTATTLIPDPLHLLTFSAGCLDNGSGISSGCRIQVIQPEVVPT
jgi:hypothetical protein